MNLSFINIRKVPREMLKTSGFALGFQHFPRDFANVNEWKIMFDPYHTKLPWSLLILLMTFVIIFNNWFHKVQMFSVFSNPINMYPRSRLKTENNLQLDQSGDRIFFNHITIYVKLLNIYVCAITNCNPTVHHDFWVILVTEKCIPKKSRIPS